MCTSAEYRYILLEYKVQLLKKQALDTVSMKRRSLRLPIGDSIDIAQLQREVYHFSDIHIKLSQSYNFSSKGLRVS